MKTSIVLAAGTTLLCSAAGTALAQQAALLNGGFEIPRSAGNQIEPRGWHNLSNNTTARRRTATDGLVPAPLIRTGIASIELLGRPAGGFIAFTTDTLAPDFFFANPAIDWTKGDMVVSGWYAIPDGVAVEDQANGLKLELRLPDSQVAWAWETPVTVGDTNGQFTFLEFRVTREEMQDRFRFGTTQGFYSGVDVPNQVSILPFRFKGDGEPLLNAIYWDDVAFIQEEAGPSCGSTDFDGDGDEGTDADIEAFFAVIGGNACPTGTCGSVDFDGDGDEGTDADIEAFFRVIGGGPCEL